MTFDLDLWTTDLKTNRDHLLTKDYLPTKFEASWAKHSWVISCTRLRDTDIPTDRHTDRHTYRPTYRPTGAKQYAPPFSKGGINILIHYIYNMHFHWLWSRKFVALKLWSLGHEINHRYLTLKKPYRSKIRPNSLCVTVCIRKVYTHKEFDLTLLL